MKAVIVFILWLILGVFYWSQKTNCCQAIESPKPVNEISSQEAIEEESDVKISEIGISDENSDQNETLDSGDSIESKEQEEDQSVATGNEDNTESDDDQITEQDQYDNAGLSNANVFYFESNSYKKITNDRSVLLSEIVGKLSGNFNKVILTGYADSNGGDSGNYLIGKKRADFIKDLLIRRGISPQRILTYTKGDKRPVDGENEAVNRRVEFKIIK